MAVPVAPAQTCQKLAELADEVIGLVTPEPFWSIGQWYDDFAQVGDEEVRRLLEQSAAATKRDRVA